MIISHRLKFAYFRPPKTGSTSATFYLRICGAFDENDTMAGQPEYGLERTSDIPDFVHGELMPAHYTPTQAIEKGLITLEQLREYKSVAFIRDPFARTLSAIIHQSGRFCDPTFVQLYVTTYTEFIERNGLLNSFQSDWHFVDGEQVIEPILFDDYEVNLRALIKQVGGIDFPVMPALNARPHTRGAYTMEEWMTPEFIDHVETRYTDDIELYNKTKELQSNTL